MSDEIIDLTRKLLRSIAQADWPTYTDLCDLSLTCFEPEAQGFLVEGMAFHRFYFDQPDAGSNPANVTISSPHVRMLGDDVAVISYVRLNQSIRRDVPVTDSFEETRVWHRQDGKWKHVHFHRSKPTRPRRR